MSERVVPTERVTVAYELDDGPDAHRIGLVVLDEDCLEPATSDVTLPQLPPEAIYQAALKTCRPDADALFIACTGIRAVEVIERVEAALAKPVLAAIQTLFWQSLRSTGYVAPIQGFGRLLRV